MKKSLLALAVMGAFAGVAQAQITVYGLIDTGIASSDDGVDRTTEMRSSIGAASRWGIRGSEDLGNGLKAHFLLETGFGSDEGTTGTAGFNRLSYVGLDGGFGTVRLGRQDTAMKDALGKIDPFSVADMANAQNIFLNGQTQRRPDQLTYLTPNFGGFSGGVYYNFGEVPGDSSAEQIFGLRASYENGPLNVQLAHETLSDAVAADNDQQDT